MPIATTTFTHLKGLIGGWAVIGLCALGVLSALWRMDGIGGVAMTGIMGGLGFSGIWMAVRTTYRLKKGSGVAARIASEKLHYLPWAKPILLSEIQNIEVVELNGNVDIRIKRHKGIPRYIRQRHIIEDVAPLADRLRDAVALKPAASS